MWDLLRNTLTGEKGLGGIETRGLLRRGMPVKEHEVIIGDRVKGKEKERQ